MRIEIKGGRTRAFCQQAVNVFHQYPNLMKHPQGKLKNYFRSLQRYVTICTALLVILGAMCIFWGPDALTITAMVLMALLIVLSSAFLFRLNQLCRQMMEDHRRTVLTLDEEGVELEKEGAQRVRLAWSAIAFVRVFSEALCFIPGDSTGLVMAVSRDYQEEILAYLREHNPDLPVIQV